MSDQIDSGRETRIIFGSKVVNGVSGVIGIIIFVNVLGAEGIGTYFTLFALITVATSLTKGVGTAAEHKAGLLDSHIERSKYSTASLVISLSISIIISSLLLFVYYLGPNFKIIKISEYSALISILIILDTSAGTVIGGTFSGSGNPGRNSIILAMCGILQTLFKILFLFYLTDSIVALLLGDLISGLVATLYLYYVKSPFQIKKPDLTHIKELYQYSRWSSLNNLTRQLKERSPIILVAILLGPGAVGVYEAASRITRPVQYPIESASRSILVSSSQDDDLNTSTLDTIGSYAPVLALPMIVGSTVIGFELIILIYGSEFSNGYSILVGSSVYLTLLSQSEVLSSYLDGKQRPDIPAKSVLISTIVVVLCGLYLIDLVGLVGSIVAVISAETVRLLFLSRIINRRAKYKPTRVIYQVISSVAMFIFIYPTKILVEGLSLEYQVPIIILVGVVVYSISMIALDSSVRDYIESRVLSKLRNHRS